MRITFKTKPEHTPWPRILDMWMEGEAIDIYDGGWLFDHFWPLYDDPSGPCLEGWTALSFLAGRTKRLRLGLMVTGNPYRNPGVLANMAATFDHFSEGRLDLGIGAGWYEQEATAYGMDLLPMKQRLDQFEESVKIIKSLLTEKQTTFEGEHYTIRDAYCEPKPIQKPYPPLCMGGSGEKRMLRIVAEHADDWNFVGGTVDELEHKIEVLHGHCEAIGRDPAEITISAHVFPSADPSETAAQTAAFAEVGCRHMCLYYMDTSSPKLMGPTAEAVAESVASYR